MSFRKFIQRAYYPEFTKQRILFANAEIAGMIPKERLDVISSSLKYYFAKRLASLGISGVLAVCVPTPTGFIIENMLRLSVFTIAFRGMVYKIEIDLLEKINEAVNGLDLESKIEELNIPEKDKETLEGIMKDK
ncbi:hypothetical protein SteCoe_4002 [Stentor coeruleus]|uniref:Uncharacterized protein n=1 Tax=Stentor coeruleus TaxID=5963 RepID=A0A1R2BY00_9CILI|nr:hypothetical protein SteCoe_17924 [Stentor coeruleus]OMJ93062.1 hypothetical protein SteCoe_4002 [Stentor coeruleus]